MIRQEFNYLQKNIIEHEKIYPEGNAFYQKLEVESLLDGISLYNILLCKFPILKAVVDIEQNIYTIENEIDTSKITIINNLNHKDFKFNYEKYLFALFTENNKKILIFHHLFIDGTSENLIYSYIINNTIEVDTNKYYNYLFNYEVSEENKTTLLNTDYKSPNNFVENKGEISELILDVKESEITSICEKLNISSHTYYLGILALVVKVYSMNSEVIIHDMFSGRNNDFKKTIGFFSFTSKINISLNEENTFELFFKELYCNLKKNIKICSSVQNPNIIMNDVRKLSVFKNSKISRENGNNIPNQLELKIIDFNHILFKYNTNVFSENTIKRISKLYHWCFKKLMSINLQINLKNFDVITDADKLQVLQWGKGEYIEPMTRPIYEYIDKNTTNNIAIQYQTKKITYRELKNITDNISNFLKGKKLYQESIVMSLERDENIPLWMLGILKSGNIYIPVLPDIPIEQFNNILQETNTKLIITNEKYKNKFINNKNEVFYIENFINKNFEKIEIDSPEYAYIIFTSGTTNKPKGIKFSHYSLTNGIFNCISTFPNYNSLYATQISWDPNFRELFIPLLKNKTVFICKNLLKDELPSEIKWINGTPNLLKYLKIPKNLKLITSSGEKINKQYWENVSQIENIWSFYGPTETFDVATINKIKNFNVLLGKPLPNYNIYIVKHHKIAPVGIVGEIYIGGITLGHCYINNQELTDNKFIQFNNERVYKTGDYGKWNENGELEFLGRCDDQIKKNGIRIELEEIEMKIKEITDINDCSILFEDDLLYCFTTPNTNIDIKKILQTKLPKYMIPSFYYTLNEIPLTVNGKKNKTELLTYINRFKIEKENDYKIVTEYISSYIYCNFALIKKKFDNFTNQCQICLYINTNKNREEILQKLLLNVNPYWIIKVDNNSIQNLPECCETDTVRNLSIQKYMKFPKKKDIYDILCEILNIDYLNEDISLDNYGINSIDFIRLDYILSNKYGINVNLNDSYNNIINKTKNYTQYCNFKKNPNIEKVNKLLVFFKGAANQVPTLLSNNSVNQKLLELHCDFLIITNYKFRENGRYDDVNLFNELKIYTEKYKEIYYISNSLGWESCVYFSDFANKCLISGAGAGDDAFTSKMKEKIQFNYDKLFFFYGNNRDFNFLINIENKLSLKIKKFENPFYKNKTHGIFMENKINEYLNFLKEFISN